MVIPYTVKAFKLQLSEEEQQNLTKTNIIRRTQRRTSHIWRLFIQLNLFWAYRKKLVEHVKGNVTGWKT